MLQGQENAWVFKWSWICLWGGLRVRFPFKVTICIVQKKSLSTRSGSKATLRKSILEMRRARAMLLGWPNSSNQAEDTNHVKIYQSWTRALQHPSGPFTCHVSVLLQVHLDNIKVTARVYTGWSMFMRGEVHQMELSKPCLRVTLLERLLFQAQSAAWLFTTNLSEYLLMSYWTRLNVCQQSFANAYALKIGASRFKEN